MLRRRGQDTLLPKAIQVSLIYIVTLCQVPLKLTLKYIKSLLFVAVVYVEDSDSPTKTPKQPSSMCTIFLISVISTALTISDEMRNPFCAVLI